LTLLADYWLLA